MQRAEKEHWSYEALLQMLFAEEVAHRRGTRLSRALHAAAFPFLRTVEESDLSYQSTLRLTTIGSMLSPDFITEGPAAILVGKPGRGKAHLAIAYRALQNGFDVIFTTAAELIDDLSQASRQGKLRNTLVRYTKPHLLLVDEVGYLAYGDDAANVFFHVVNDRTYDGARCSSPRTRIPSAGAPSSTTTTSAKRSSTASSIVDACSASTVPRYVRSTFPTTSSSETINPCPSRPKFLENKGQSFRNPQDDLCALARSRPD